MTSSNENTPLLGNNTSASSGTSQSKRNKKLNHFPDDPEFQKLIERAEVAINKGFYPERISQGSSGSYFVKDDDGNKVGVFKPKDEEPYGDLNPKWTKWMQRCLCPCCFGRSCIVPNQGYLSEAGASLVDEMLHLDIVPKTKVVHFASETFNYSAVDRAAARTKMQMTHRFPSITKHFHRIGLPPKIGSFQTFVKDFMDADYWIKQFESETLPKVSYNEFLFQFQKLVVLDYIIRNTDRGNDNWLIKCDRPEVFDSDLIEADTGEWDIVDVPRVKLAAIDNGLAFPCKHPDEWRAYPFQWSWLSIAKEPFTQELCDLILPKLQDNAFIDTLIVRLKNLFKVDKNFKKGIFKSQMSVLCGQVINLTDALQTRECPLQLVNRPVLYAERLPDCEGLQTRQAPNRPLFPHW